MEYKVLLSKMVAQQQVVIVEADTEDLATDKAEKYLRTPESKHADKWTTTSIVVPAHSSDITMRESRSDFDALGLYTAVYRD